MSRTEPASVVSASVPVSLRRELERRAEADDRTLSSFVRLTLQHAIRDADERKVVA
jgi:hypothetical protein